jgi:hypothetical protein
MIRNSQISAISTIAFRNRMFIFVEYSIDLFDLVDQKILRELRRYSCLSIHSAILDYSSYILLIIENIVTHMINTIFILTICENAPSMNR